MFAFRVKNCKHRQNTIRALHVLFDAVVRRP